MKSNKNILGLVVSIVVIVVIIGGIAWYVFMNASGAKSMNSMQAVSSSTMPGGREMGAGGAGMRGGFVMGSIESLNDTGFTVTLSDGTTKTVDLTATTTLQNYTSPTATPTTITADQLSVGEQVSVIGSPNADGSVTARTVRTGTPPTRAPGAGGYGQGRRNSTTSQQGTPSQ